MEKLKIVPKGITEQKKGEKTFDPQEVKIEEQDKIIHSNVCIEYDFINKENGDSMLTMGLEQDYLDEYNNSCIKLRTINGSSEYYGSGIALLAIKKALEIAKYWRKELVIDCHCSISLYKALKKCEEAGMFKIQENPKGIILENGTYVAEPLSWTFKLVQ
jgi:hypothetical protein